MILCKNYSYMYRVDKIWFFKIYDNRLHRFTVKEVSGCKAFKYDQIYSSIDFEDIKYYKNYIMFLVFNMDLKCKTISTKTFIRNFLK